jgi:hypothetical protein
VATPCRTDQRAIVRAGRRAAPPIGVSAGLRVVSGVEIVVVPTCAA